jgi:hypothetical protein
MKSRIVKTRILDLCIQKQNELIDNLNNRKLKWTVTFSQIGPPVRVEDHLGQVYELLAGGDELKKN